jgi:excisionase family DNA binding protein
MPPRTPFPSSRLIAAKVASIETGIAYTTLRDLTFRGEIPVVQVGRAWYFDRRDLENWIASHKERLAQ